MKRRDLVNRIATEARRRGVTWTFHGEGGNHTIYTLAGRRVPIPRHREIGERTAEGICKECEFALGKRWWT